MEALRSIGNEKGYTLMEIMVTMLIMTMVTLMIYEALSDQHRSFFTIMKRSDAIRESVLVKKKVDRLFSAVDTTLYVNRMRLDYLDSDGQKHSLQVRNGLLSFDNDSIGGKISGAKFSLDESDCDVQTLFWEISFENGNWIGGAKNIY